MSEIYILGAIQGFFFAFLLMSKKNRMTADLYLAAFLFFLSLSLFSDYLLEIKVLDNHPGVSLISLAFPLIFGPLIWLYANSLIKGIRKINWSILLHFIPAIIFFLVIFDFFKFEKDQQLEILYNGFYYISIKHFIINFIVLLSVPIYIILIFSKIVLNNKNIRENYSSLEKVNLNWLSYTTGSFALIWIIILILLSLNFFTDFVIPMGNKFYMNLSFTLFIFITGYFGLKQTGIYISSELPVLKNQKKMIDEKSAPDLKDSKIINYDKETDLIVEFVKNRKPYLDNELTLKSLAEMVGVQPYILSEIMNKKLRRSFFEFVHYYRIEEVKYRLSQPVNRHYTILSVAFDCGFNSKSSFNRIFKDMTGQTPSEYIAQMKNDAKIRNEYNKGG